jgi:hypothetical protein
MNAGGCVACGGRCPRGFLYCRSCHAYNDIFQTVRHAGIGLDERRLRRALFYLRPHRAEPLSSLVAKLMRRVEELEAIVG